MSFYFINIHSKLFSYIAFFDRLYVSFTKKSFTLLEWMDSCVSRVILMSTLQYEERSNISTMLQYVFICVEFLGLDILLSELWPQQCACIQGNTVSFIMFNHSCVCFRPAWEMMKAGAVFHSFCWVEVLLCLGAEGNVTDLLSLHLSASFWNLQPSGLYRFCPSFLFASCWDSNLKLRWRFRTARRTIFL